MAVTLLLRLRVEPQDFILHQMCFLMASTGVFVVAAGLAAREQEREAARGTGHNVWEQ